MSGVTAAIRELSEALDDLEVARLDVQRLASRLERRNHRKVRTADLAELANAQERLEAQLARVRELDDALKRAAQTDSTGGDAA